MRFATLIVWFVVVWAVRGVWGICRYRMVGVRNVLKALAKMEVPLLTVYVSSVLPTVSTVLWALLEQWNA